MMCDPVAVAVAGNNTVFIADGQNNRVLAYDPRAALSPTPTPSATPSTAPTLITTPTPTRTLLPTRTPALTPIPSATPTSRRTSTPTHTHTPTPTPTPPECIGTTPKPTVPVPTPTPLPGHPRISSVTSPVLAGASFIIKGSGFTKGSVVNFFVATPKGPVNEGPLKPDPTSSTTTELVVPVPGTITLGEGFVALVVINTDKGFIDSNPAFRAAAGFAGGGITEHHCA